MNRWRTAVAVLLLVEPAGSVTPCLGPAQAGELQELQLLSVRTDGIPVTDISVYAGYHVSVRGQVAREPRDGVTHYVHFAVERQEAGRLGDEQAEFFGEFYPVYAYEARPTTGGGTPPVE